MKSSVPVVLFLPPDVDFQTVIHSLQAQLLNKYFLFISGFLNNSVTPSSAKIAMVSIFRFHFMEGGVNWGLVEPEIQRSVLEAILDI